LFKPKSPFVKYFFLLIAELKTGQRQFFPSQGDGLGVEDVAFLNTIFIS
jgi:hypothetical protein